MLLLCYQTAQLTHVINERLKETTEDAEREKALKDIAIAMTKEKGKAAEAIEKKGAICGEGTVSGGEKVDRVGG